MNPGGGGGGYSEYILVGVLGVGISQKGVLGAGTAPKKGGS